MTLAQQKYTYRHGQVLHLLASKLKEMLKDTKSNCVDADLQGWRSSGSPQATIPTALVSTPLIDRILLSIILLQPQLQIIRLALLPRSGRQNVVL